MRYVICLCICTMVLPARAQRIQFFGLGRAVVSKERLSGKIVEGDTSNPTRSMGGYTLLDMGVRFHPFHYLKGHAILRVKNSFGIFWGEGTSLDMRQFRFEGVAARVIRFEIGDIDVRMSPFTLHVPDIYPVENLPEVFRIRKRIQEYENFISDQQRRLQGVTFFSSLKSTNENHKLQFRAMIARNPPDQLPGESRMLAGGTIKYAYKEFLTARMNLLQNFQLQQMNVSNEVDNFTGTIQYNLLKKISRKAEVSLEGESGLSNHQLFFKNDSLKNVNGYFTWNEGKLTIAGNLVLSTAYVYVSPFFYSSGAQTPLYSYYQVPSSFPFYSNLYLQRPQLLFDHFLQEDIYNRSIRTNLWPYFPNYNNIFPYGIATPNRTGLFIKTSWKDRLNAGNIQGEYFTGKEVSVEQVKDPRTFSMITVSSGLELSKVNNWSKKFKVTATYRNQHTERSGLMDSAFIHLRSSYFNAGMEIEPLKNFHLLAGAAYNTATGNEYIPFRDITNSVYQYSPYHSNSEEWLVSAGMLYKFSAHSFFTAHMNAARVSDTGSGTPELKIMQLYLNFTASF